MNNTITVKEAQRLIIELVHDDDINYEISYGSIIHRIEQIMNKVPKCRLREMTSTLRYAHLVLDKQ